MFDRKVFHDGRENSYEFVHDGQRYKLLPILENDGSNTNNSNRGVNNCNNRIMLCSTKKFLKEHK